MTKLQPDPLFLPVTVDLANRQELAYALAHLIPRHLASKAIGVVCNRASLPQTVSDATTDRDCVACRLPVWVAPSSKRVENGVFVCLTCIEETVKNQ